MSSNLREDVFANLDAALENGCFQSSGYLFEYSAEDIAKDMMLSLELPVEDEKELVPHIEAWMQENLGADGIEL